jgi:hypothetical protein
MSGCTDSPSSPVALQEQTISAPRAPANLAKSQPILHSANGACSAFYDGKICSWSFNAREYADGTFDGVVQIYVHSQPREYGFLHCKVLSLKVHDLGSGVKAAVIGMVEVEKGPFNGSYDAFVVYDYGEGSKAPPDMYTNTICWDPDNSLENMQKIWNMSPDDVILKILEIHPGMTRDDVLTPIQQGNIQVR